MLAIDGIKCDDLEMKIAPRQRCYFLVSKRTGKEPLEYKLGC